MKSNKQESGAKYLSQMDSAEQEAAEDMLPQIKEMLADERVVLPQLAKAKGVTENELLAEVESDFGLTKD